MNRRGAALLLLVIALLSGCSGGNKDFKEARWGMAIKDVVSLEERVGNEKFEESEGYSGDIRIEFEDMIINGYKADVEYNFNNQVNAILTMSEHDFKKLADSGDDFPEIIKFNDFILTEGRYYFRDVDEEDGEDILESLTSKYGEPTDQDDSYFWYGKRSIIYFDGEDYVSYRASFSVLDKIGNENKGRKKNSNGL